MRRNKLRLLFRLLYSVLIVTFLYAPLLIAAELSEGAYDEAVVLNPQVKAVNGGFNPEFYAYRINGSVVVGSNHCDARGVRADFKQVIEDNVLYLMPALFKSESASTVCSSEYRPVVVPVEAIIRRSRKEVEKIVLLHVGDRGETLTVIP